ncbi:Histone-lysine N-methyltransferase SETMAR [Eumeta japonica]|uniref:Histone-lysine N-methyltransferase SETMAR n=1 Tax=Eumeta variegata TaxID=151549 RepID=A0A4C1V3N8_EUMVA|nr:Histone-lysine N-methyltransferase SETMAR [Eumeta japonica]
MPERKQQDSMWVFEGDSNNETSGKTNKIEVGEKCRRPVTVVTKENVRKIEKLVLADRRIKLWQIAEELQISKEQSDNIDEICDRIVTVDETWVRQYDPESKQESMQWTKKEKGRRRNSRHERQSYKSDGKLSRGVLFLHDNASVHTARVSRQALKDTGFSEIDHPPYSPDLASSDYFLFSNLKKELRGRRFDDDNQMKMAVESQRKGIFFGWFEGVIH